VLHVPTGLLLGWVAWVARTGASLPLGELGAPHLAAVVAVGVLFAAGGRKLAVALVAVVLALPGLALRAPPPVQVVAPDVRVERQDGTVAAIITGDVSSADVLEGLRRGGVEHLDRVVVERPGSRTAAVGDALRERFGAALPIVAGSR
jgi:hypothetical protein